MERIARTLLILLLFTPVSSLLAQSSAAPAPATAAAAEKPDYSKEAVVYEQYRTAYRFENDGTGRRVTTARIRVQSDAGVKMLGQLVFGYNASNETIQIDSVRVHKSDSTTVTAPPDAVQDLTSPIQREAPIYTDTREKHVTVPALRAGDVLEYQVTNITTTAYAPNQFWMAYEFEQNAIVLDEQLELDIPAGRKVTLKMRPGTKPEEREINGRHIYAFKSSHTVREDDSVPRTQQAIRERRKKMARLAKEREVPAVQLTTFQSWAEVGKWYAGLEKEMVQPSPEVKAKADALVKDKKSDTEKIEALYDYVARNFRYVSLSLGLSRYQPHANGEVYKNEYGDCKDKHTLLSAMLRAEGFRANAALMNSSRKIDPDVPSPAQFDHVITQLPLGAGPIWMDTTSEVAPFRLLVAPIRHKKALVVPQGGEAGLQETPAAPPFESYQRFDVTGEVNELGKLTGHMHYAFRGDVELWVRYSLRQMPQANWNRFAEALAQLQGNEGEVTNLKISDPNDVDTPLSVDFDVASPGFVDWSSKRSVLNVPALPPNLPQADDEPQADADPITLGAPGEIRSTFKIKLPGRYNVQMPLPFTVKRDYAEYSASYAMKDGVMSGERLLRVAMPEVPVARTGDYLSFRKTVDADQEQRIALESTHSGAAVVAESANIDEMEQAAEDALRAGNYEVAVDLYKRILGKDATRKNASNMLGRAYLGGHKYDEAVEAFRKAAEADPYDESAYNNMGFAYSQTAKYDLAAEAFRKQLEVNPLDRFSHTGLGNVYLEQQKYAEAAAELEKAASLNADNPAIEVSLGRAYLNLDQRDKALAAFDKAVELEPSAGVFNDVAYELARKQVSLDRALQYAESAIAATSATLRNVNLEHLTLQQTNLVSSLANFWDTLGWVYFQRGDLTAAEKYIRGSWWLQQHGEVGDHLGQIYEKQGKKDAAVQAYAMALASERPFPESRGHLTHLLGSDSRIADLVKSSAASMQLNRTFRLGRLLPGGLKEKQSADFFLLLAPPGKVEVARFVRGSDALRGSKDAIQAADLGSFFPDASPAKVVRRGTLSCEVDGDCTLVLLGADGVVSLE